MQNRSLALSLELRDIDAALSPKSGSIRKYLEL
jgi:5-carboxymethyl-2-hydroxymuconate isomerase